MRIVFFILALLSLVFWGFGVFDMWAMLTGWSPYVHQHDPNMIAWIQGFALWRKAIWGASLAFGVIGSLMMLVRSRAAGPLLVLAWLLLVGGFSYDLVLQDGVHHYGQNGLVSSGVIIVVAALFAWAGLACGATKIASPTSKSKSASAPETNAANSSEPAQPEPVTPAAAAVVASAQQDEPALASAPADQVEPTSSAAAEADASVASEAAALSEPVVMAEPVPQPEPQPEAAPPPASVTTETTESDQATPTPRGSDESEASGPSSLDEKPPEA